MGQFIKIKVFTDKYPFLGPIIWILSVQYFIVQIIVGVAYKYSYSLRFNTISDLGNTSCGIYSGRYVCSPLHNLMNASFIMLGLTMALGSLLIYQEFRKDRGTLVGFSLMAIAGLGTLFVGIFPENTISLLHTLGASMPFILGNIALIIMSLYLLLPSPFKIYTFVSGVIALFFLILFKTSLYGSFGIGGIERIVAYPQTIWLIFFGIYMTRNEYLKRSK
ncbi:MAG: DUF998 domain-containing protein [Candidatus Saccharimonadales bacterium]